MSSQWVWNSIDLWIASEDISREIKRAELFILDGTDSVFHFFGSGSRKYNFKGIVIGDANRLSIEDDATGNTTRTLTTPWGSVSSLKIGTVKFTAKPYAGATIGGVTYLSSATPIYDFEMEMITVA
jgi:hypothetical protein